MTTMTVCGLVETLALAQSLRADQNARRPSRSHKRKKFDDEVVESGPTASAMPKKVRLRRGFVRIFIDSLLQQASKDESSAAAVEPPAVVLPMRHKSTGVSESIFIIMERISNFR